MGNILKKNKTDLISIELVDENLKIIENTKENESLNNTNIIEEDEEKININTSKEEIFMKEDISEEELFLRINKIQCFLFYIKLYRWGILLFTINFISYCVYATSLQSCGFMSTNMCTDIRGMKWYYKIVILALIAGIIQGIFITLVFIRCYGYKHLLYDFPIYFLFFYFYDGTRVDEHGLYNSMIFIIGFLATSFSLTFLFYFIYFIYNYNNNHKI